MSALITDKLAQEILGIISDYTKVSIEDIIGESRIEDFVTARTLFCGVCAKVGFTRTATAKYINRKHCDVCHHVNRYRYLKTKVFTITRLAIEADVNQLIDKNYGQE